MITILTSVLIAMFAAYSIVPVGRYSWVTETYPKDPVMVILVCMIGAIIGLGVGVIVWLLLGVFPSKEEKQTEQTIEGWKLVTSSSTLRYAVFLRDSTRPVMISETQTEVKYVEGEQTLLTLSYPFQNPFWKWFASEDSNKYVLLINKEKI